MLDDRDRQFCAILERVFRAGLQTYSEWPVKVTDVIFHDPGMMLVVEIPAMGGPAHAHIIISNGYPLIPDGPPQMINGIYTSEGRVKNWQLLWSGEGLEGGTVDVDEARPEYYSVEFDGDPEEVATNESFARYAELKGSDVVMRVTAGRLVIDGGGAKVEEVCEYLSSFANDMFRK